MRSANALGPDLTDWTVRYNCLTKGCGLSGLAKTWRRQTSVRYSLRHGSRQPQQRHDWSDPSSTRMTAAASHEVGIDTATWSQAPRSSLAASSDGACG
jgi:hypothetical protein